MVAVYIRERIKQVEELKRLETELEAGMEKPLSAEGPGEQESSNQPMHARSTPANLNPGSVASRSESLAARSMLDVPSTPVGSCTGTSKVFRVGQVVLGSQQHARTFEDLEESTQDVAFKDFRKRLLTWLKVTLPPEALVSNGKLIQLLSSDKVSINVVSPTQSTASELQANRSKNIDY